MAVGPFIFNKCLATFFTKLASGARSPSHSPEAAKKNYIRAQNEPRATDRNKAH